MTSNKTVTATFTQNVYTLTVSKVGSGSVTLNNTGPYHFGDVVRLTAVPSTGWSFSAWSGALTGSTNPISITIDGNKNVTATFATIPLVVSISPTSVNLTSGEAVTFIASVSGGKAPYTYQWYLNDAAVPDATNSTWTFIPEQNKEYAVHVKVADAQGTQSQSNVVNDITVASGGGFPVLGVVVGFLAVVVALAAVVWVYFKKRKRRTDFAENASSPK
jgi:hypothetical protein